MAQPASTTTYQKSAYQQWIESEGIPITEESYGIADVTAVPRGPWARTGGSGAFIQLKGTTQLGRGVYMGEIPGGGALNPERHLYEELIYVIKGRGLTEVWQKDGDRKQLFEWGESSFFAMPINTWHRLINASQEPVVFMAVTNAPTIMNIFHNLDFVFNCDFHFSDRYDGRDNYFAVGDKHVDGPHHVWETNFVPDIRTAMLDEKGGRKVSGGSGNQFELAGNITIAHLSHWPVGRYHKAHYHGPGAVLVGLRSTGYALMWDHELGTHPYENGHEADVVQMAWGSNSIYSPLSGWYHQHFNTGNEPARQLAFRYGSLRHRGIAHSELIYNDAVMTTTREGGMLIEYEDEDPEIRRRYEDALKREGVECQMPALAVM